VRGGRAGFGMHAGLWLEYDQEAIIGLQTSTHPFAFGVGGGSREKRSLPTSLREVLRAGLPAVLQRCRRPARSATALQAGDHTFSRGFARPRTHHVAPAAAGLRNLCLPLASYYACNAM